MKSNSALKIIFIYIMDLSFVVLMFLIIINKLS